MGFGSGVGTDVLDAAPRAWSGEPARAYTAWARRQVRAVTDLDAALRRAEEIAADGRGDGAALAARLAGIDLPAAVPAGGPPGVVPERPKPAAQRDRENRARLAADLRDLRGRSLTKAEKARLRMLETIDARLTELGRTVDPVTGAVVPVQLFEYEPDAFAGDGIVVVSIGDLDSARNVGVLVPGMGTTAASIGDVGRNAVALRDAARRAAPGASTATVAWIGYDAPSGARAVPEVVTPDRALRGAADLKADLTDIAAMRSGIDSRVVVFGHSYGSTTAATAGAGGGLAGTVDAMVLLGSPGAGPVRSAAELDMPVFVAKDPDDPVPRVGWTDGAARRLEPAFGVEIGLGTDPAAPSFGAARVAADGPTGPGLSAHSGYFSGGTLEAFARILTGADGAR